MAETGELLHIFAWGVPAPSAEVMHPAIRERQSERDGETERGSEGGMERQRQRERGWDGETDRRETGGDDGIPCISTSERDIESGMERESPVLSSAEVPLSTRHLQP